MKVRNNDNFTKGYVRDDGYGNDKQCLLNFWYDKINNVNNRGVCYCTIHMQALCVLDVHGSVLSSWGAQECPAAPEGGQPNHVSVPLRLQRNLQLHAGVNQHDHRLRSALHLHLYRETSGI